MTDANDHLREHGPDHMRKHWDKEHSKARGNSHAGGVGNNPNGGIGENDRQPDPKNTGPKTLDDWLSRNLPSPDFLMGHWFTTTTRALLSADTGLGKTMFGMAVGMRASAGLGFLHWSGVRKCRVLYIDGEMSRRLLRDRLKDEVKRIGHAPKTFFPLSREDIENFPPLNTEEGQTFIDKQIEAYGGVDFIIFDNIMSLLLGNMRDEEPWQRTVPWCRKLTARSIGQLWIHHTGHDTSRQYGDKTREWQMDTTIHLDKVERADTDVSFKLQFPKARERRPETREDFAVINIALVNDKWEFAGVDKAIAKQPPSPVGKKFYDAFLNCTAIVKNGRQCVLMESWRKECATLRLIDPSEPKRASASFSKYRLELIARNWIACNEDTVWKV